MKIVVRLPAVRYVERGLTYVRLILHNQTSISSFGSWTALKRYSNIAANLLLHSALGNEALIESLSNPEGRFSLLLVYLL